MKIVLQKDVKGLGRAWSIIDAKDGFALNHLIPQGAAVPATPANIAKAELKKKMREDEKHVQEKLISERMSALSDGRVVITRKVNDKGHLYEAVTAHSIAEATKLPEEVIKLEKPIKELGQFQVPVYFDKDFGTITVSVESE